MIRLPGGMLTWAELFSKTEGLLKPSVPAANAPASELTALQAGLPKFLGSRDADDVNNVFANMKDNKGGKAMRPGLRPRPEALPAATTPSAAQVGAAIQQASGADGALLA